MMECMLAAMPKLSMHMTLFETANMAMTVRRVSPLL